MFDEVEKKKVFVLPEQVLANCPRFLERTIQAISMSFGLLSLKPSTSRKQLSKHPQ